MKDRLLSRVRKQQDSGCWIWQGATKGMGYGYLTVGSRVDNSRRTALAHRESYAAFVGEIPKGMYVCHHCDIPACINPDHLFIGTNQDNVDDREMKGRNDTSGIKLRHESHPAAKLKWIDIRRIRTDVEVKGWTQQKIADEMGVSRSTIKDILHMRTWIPEPPTDTRG